MAGEQDRAERRGAKAWGGRFAKATAPTVEAFTESISFDWRLYRQDIAASIAHARMLGRQGIIATGEETRTIIAGLVRDRGGDRAAASLPSTPAARTSTSISRHGWRRRSATRPASSTPPAVATTR